MAELDVTNEMETLVYKHELIQSIQEEERNPHYPFDRHDTAFFEEFTFPQLQRRLVVTRRINELAAMRQMADVPERPCERVVKWVKGVFKLVCRSRSGQRKRTGRRSRQRASRC